MLLFHVAYAVQACWRAQTLHKMLRRAEADAYMDDLIHQGRMRILRASMVAKWRQNPLNIPLTKDIHTLTDAELEFYAALFLDKDEVSTPPYDSITGK